MEVTPVRRATCRKAEILTPIVEAGCRRGSVAKGNDCDEPKVEKQFTAAVVEDGAVELLREAKESKSLFDVVQEDEEPTESAASGAADEAPILVTRAEKGIVEFELDGQIYRVHDAAAFAGVVKTPPRSKKRSLADFRRAQKLARQSEAANASGEVTEGRPARGGEDAVDGGGSGRGAVARAFRAAAGPSLAEELANC